VGTDFGTRVTNSFDSAAPGFAESLKSLSASAPDAAKLFMLLLLSGIHGIPEIAYDRMSRPRVWWGSGGERGYSILPNSIASRFLGTLPVDDNINKLLDLGFIHVEKGPLNKRTLRIKHRAWESILGSLSEVDELRWSQVIALSHAFPGTSEEIGQVPLTS